MRTILANRSIEKYLQKCGGERKLSFGLIIGQSYSQNKDLIVHLAKNSENEDGTEINVVNAENHEGDASQYSLKGIEELDDNALSHQVLSLIKMIPGCFFVLGIFFVDESDVFENSAITAKIVFLLEEINRIFKENKHFNGNSKALGNDKIVMFYNSANKTTQCRYHNSKDKTNFIPADLVFLDKPTEWTLFETNYELDEVFPIVEKTRQLNIETHFTATLQSIYVYIKNSKIFIQDEPVDDAVTLETYIKKNQYIPEKPKGIPVSIFLTARPSREEPVIIEEYDGLIRYSGIIASRIWAHPKNSFEEIYNFIRTDIIRSLASRIQIYNDGLIDPNASRDSVVINEPPRRVFFNKSDENEFQFCDYIFRGEDLSVVTAQAKYILDVVIEPVNVIDTVEGNPDDEIVTFNKLLNPLKNQTKYKVREYGQIMYMAGLATAIFVLLISIFLHFMLQ